MAARRHTENRQVESIKSHRWFIGALRKAKSVILKAKDDRECLARSSTTDASSDSSIWQRRGRSRTPVPPSRTADSQSIPQTDDVISHKSLSGSSPATTGSDSLRGDSRISQHDQRSGSSPSRATNKSRLEENFLRAYSTLRGKRQSCSSNYEQRSTASSLFYVHGNGSRARLRPSPFLGIDIDIPDSKIDHKFEVQRIGARSGNVPSERNSDLKEAEVDGVTHSGSFERSSAADTIGSTQPMTVAARFDVAKGKQREHWSTLLTEKEHHGTATASEINKCSGLAVQEENHIKVKDFYYASSNPQDEEDEIMVIGEADGLHPLTRVSANQPPCSLDHLQSLSRWCQAHARN